MADLSPPKPPDSNFTAPRERVAEEPKGMVSVSLVLRSSCSPLPRASCVLLLLCTKALPLYLKNISICFSLWTVHAASSPEHKLITKSLMKKEERKDISVSLCLTYTCFSYLNIFEKRDAWQLINTSDALDPPFLSNAALKLIVYLKIDDV